MSTTSASRNAPLADEFPVLLRLPDLNTPVWSAASPLALEASGKTPGSMVATSFRLDSVTSAVTSAPPTSEPAAVVSSLAPTTTVETVPAQPITLPTSRIERATRGLDIANFTQWSLVKQLSTGGVLVGGLVVAYLIVLVTTPEKAPDHIPVAQQNVEVPDIELPGASPEVTVVGKVATEEKSPTESELPNVPPEPAFSKSFPTVANTQAPPPVMVNPGARSAPAPTIAPVNGTMPAYDVDREPRQAQLPPDTREARHYPTEAPGRVQPQNQFNNLPPAPPPATSLPTGPRQPVASGYPVTDPNTYLYRPAGEAPPEAERAGVARLQGTIAPPPLR